LTVKRVAGKTVAVADIYHGLRKDDLKGGWKRAKHRYKDSYHVIQYYDVIEADDKLTLKGTRVTVKKKPESYDFSWTTDTLTADWKQDGILAGRSFLRGTNSLNFYFINKNALKTPLPLDLKKGQMHGQVTCLDDSRYHYACYIPKSYDPARPTPLLVNDSASSIAGPLSPALAEKYGWIMIGLRDSVNRRWAIKNESNCAAAIFDCRRRFNIDPRRIYFSGSSGGSRRSSKRGLMYADHCAGIICVAAGYMQYSTGKWRGRYKYPPTDIPVYFIIGEKDGMCGPEIMQTLYPREKKAGRPCYMHKHPGGHSWASKEVHEASMQWLEEQWAKGKR